MSQGSTATRCETAPRYREITAPTVVISGDMRHGRLRGDPLARAGPRHSRAPNWSGCSNLGHKPDWIAPDLVVAAIEKRRRQAATTCRRWRGSVEARIAGDAYGAGICVNEKAPRRNWRRCSEA